MINEVDEVIDRKIKEYFQMNRWEDELFHTYFGKEKSNLGKKEIMHQNGFQMGDDPEEEDGEGGGRVVQDGEHM